MFGSKMPTAANKQYAQAFSNLDDNFADEYGDSYDEQYEPSMEEALMMQQIER
jgi:hypothetical protein